jgi:hypothetical protein
MSYKLETLSFNQEGIEKIKQIVEDKRKEHIDKHLIDPTIYINSTYTIRVVKLASSVKFTSDINNNRDNILLIKDSGIIYSVLLNQNLEKNKDYQTSKSPFIRTFIYIRSGVYYERKLDVSKIIGVIKKNDVGINSQFWRDIAQEICTNYDNTLHEYLSDVNVSSTQNIVPSSIAQNIPFFKITQEGIKYIDDKIRTPKYFYYLKHDNNPDNPEFMQKILSRIDNSKVTTHGTIKFTHNVKSNFDLFILKQNNIIFALLNNGKILGTNKNMAYNRNTDYGIINVFINKKQYLIDLNDIIGIVKSDKPEGTFWYELATHLSSSIPDNGIDTSFLPAYLLQQSTVAKTNLPNPSTVAPQPTAVAKTNLPNQSTVAPQPTAVAKTNLPNPSTVAPQPTAVAKTNLPNQSTVAPQPTAVAKTNLPNPSTVAPQPAANSIPVTLPRATEKKLKKILSTTGYKEHIESLKNLSIANCKQIVQELQTIVDLSTNSQANSTTKQSTQKIKNPKNMLNPKHTPEKINFNSDIVLSALSYCYYNPDLNVQDVLDVIDLVNLYSQDRASMRQRSTTIKKNTTLNDVIDPLVIQAYKMSCDSLKTKSEITFNEYISHMSLLIRILQEMFDFIKNINNNAKYTIYLFDEITKDNYHKNVNVFTTDSMTQIDRGITFDDKKAVKNNTDVLKNTYLNRAIHLEFSQNPNILFNNVYKHNNYNDTFEFRRYMSIVPKFHYLNSSTLKKHENEIIIKLFSELDKFTVDLPIQYTIKEINKDIYIQLFASISSYTVKKDLNKLLYVLINNNYNKKQGIEDYYYYFPYDGPAPAITVLNAVNYVKFLKSYQPLDVTSTPNLLSNIDSYYKGSSPLFSRVVNESLQNHILNDVKLTENTARKLEYVLAYSQCSQIPLYYKEDIYVFHGTQNLMHAKDEQEINLISFLSCSFNIYISIDYALNNLIGSTKKYKKGIVYIFKVNHRQNYVNFGDTLYQIILLPGTKIKIQYEINIGNIKYVLCHIDDTDVLNFGKKLLEDIKQGTELLKIAYNINHFKLSGDSAVYPSIMNITFPTNPNDMKKFRDHVDNIFVTKIGNIDYIYTSLGKLINNYNMHTYNNIQFTIHQHFFNDCYHYFNVNCAIYTIGYDDNNIYTVWQVDNNFGPAYNDFKYNMKNLLIDALLGNIDCTNSKNYLVLNSDKAISRLMTLKGCGMFNTSGYRKPRFNKKQEPYEYLGIISEIMDTMPTLQNIDRLQMRTLLNCDNFLIGIKNFGEFVNHIHEQYISFLNTNLQIPTTSQEYIDLKQMLDDLKQILNARAKYFETKMDDIIDNILQYIQETHTASVLTGGDITTEFNIDNQIKQVYKNNKSNKPLSSESHIYVTQKSRSRNNIYNMIKNIPIPTDTTYKLKDLSEPYKSYYMKIIEKSQKINKTYRSKKNRSRMNSASAKTTKYDSYTVDTFNEGYCVSNAKFAEIMNKLSVSTSKKDSANVA